MKNKLPLVLTDKGTVKHIEDMAIHMMTPEQISRCCIMEIYKKDIMGKPEEHKMSDSPKLTKWFGDVSTHLRMGLIEILIKRHMRRFMSPDQMKVIANAATV